MKVSGEDRQLFFVFCNQGVGVIGKGSPDTCCDHNEATFYEHICRKISDCKKDNPYSGHQNNTDDITASESLYITVMVADYKNRQKEPGCIPDHCNQCFFI